MRSRLLAGLLAGWALASGAAAVSLGEQLDIGGYGSVSAYRGDDAVAAVRPSARVHNASRDGQWRWDGDSGLGLQLRWQPQPSLEAVLQVVASDDVAERYRPQLEWAYLNWMPSARWSARLGRQTLPGLLISENRRVAFAHAAVRPMPVVYDLNAATPVDGLNLTGAAEALGGSLTLDAGIGRSYAALSAGSVHVRRAHALALTWQRDTVLLRLAHAGFVMDLQNTGLEALLLAPGCANCATLLPARAPVNGIQGRATNVGLSWSPGPWLLTAEFIDRRSNSLVVPAATGWYLMLGYRWGRWTPYAALGANRYREPSPGLLPSASASPAAQAGVQLLDRYLQSPFDRRLALFGLRCFVGEQASVKLQWDRWRASRDTRTGRDGLIQLLRPPLGGVAAEWQGQVQMLTLSLDFVF